MSREGAEQAGCGFGRQGGGWREKTRSKDCTGIHTDLVLADAVDRDNKCVLVMDRHWGLSLSTTETHPECPNIFLISTQPRKTQAAHLFLLSISSYAQTQSYGSRSKGVDAAAVSSARVDGQGGLVSGRTETDVTFPGKL